MNQNDLKIKFGKVLPEDTTHVQAAGKASGKKGNPAKKKGTKPADTKPADAPKMPEGLSPEEQKQWEAENELQSDPQAQKDDF